MISSLEYKLLKTLKQSPELDESQWHNEISNLLRLKMINYNVTGEDKHSILYNGFFVTPVGNAAIEEYERARGSDEREKETLKAAQEANEISRKSNRISKISLIVSIVAIAVSIVSIIVNAVISQA